MTKNEKDLLDEVEMLHTELYNMKNSFEYNIGKKISKHKVFNFAYKFLRKTKDNIPEKNDVIKYMTKQNSNYDNLEKFKIVVYTCITGNYDIVQEPIYCNENVDYILFTNNEKLKSNRWKVSLIKMPNGFNNKKLNRYVKMHPHEYLKDYDYSIYVDGNIKIYSDLTSFINKIDNNIGLGLSMHSSRDKISDEIKTCEILKKVDQKELKNLISRVNDYYNEGFPDNYGLIEAPVIVTDLSNKNAKKILDNWWNEYNDNNLSRDQICLPYILWKMNIPINQIGTISNNIFKNAKLEKISHLK